MNVDKRLNYELAQFNKSEFIKKGVYHIFKAEHIGFDIIYHIDQNYPFHPPINIFLNGKDIYKCNKSQHCYPCNSYLCNGNWSPQITMKQIADDYISQLKSSNIHTYVSFILKYAHRHTIPPEISILISHFIF